MKDCIQPRTLAVHPRAGQLLASMALVGLLAVPRVSAAPGDGDLSFDPGSGVNGDVLAIAVQSDGKVLVGGEFTVINGVARAYLARLHGDPFPSALSIERSADSAINSWPASGLDFQLQENSDLALTNAWFPLPQSPVTANGRASVTVPTTGGNKSYRLKAGSE